MQHALERLGAADLARRRARLGHRRGTPRRGGRSGTCTRRSALAGKASRASRGVPSRGRGSPLPPRLRAGARRRRAGVGARDRDRQRPAQRLGAGERRRRPSTSCSTTRCASARATPRSATTTASRCSAAGPFVRQSRTLVIPLQPNLPRRELHRALEHRLGRRPQRGGRDRVRDRRRAAARRRPRSARAAA